jgi:hypothetical protein
MTDKEIWRSICKTAARDAGISVEQASAILKLEGRTARHHCGIVDAVEVVKRATGKRKRRPGRCRWVRDDGGRPDREGGNGACVPTAIAIATKKPYGKVLAALRAATRQYVKRYPRSNASRWIRRSRNGRGLDPEYGCYDQIYHRYLQSLGWQYTSTEGQKVRLRADELPPGRLIVRVHRHLCAVINGVVREPVDCSGAGWRPVKGYYTASD